MPHPFPQRTRKAQVYLGPEIVVKVTGQRALAILSRGSLILNTSIVAEPSTLGGFPGGGGIAREPDLLLLDPAVPPAFPLGSLANGSLEDFVPSYNVNGPGSASYRYYLFTISTSADDVDEIQRVSGDTRNAEENKQYMQSSLGQEEQVTGHDRYSLSCGTVIKSADIDGYLYR